jgi:hypothetical protein
MPRIRLRRKAIFYLFVIIIVILVVFNVLRWDNRVSLEKLTVNSSMKRLIQKLVPKPKRVLTFEIGRPKPEGKPSVCQFTQSNGLELLAENYLYPGDIPVERKCPGTSTIICAISGSFGSFQVSCEHNPCSSTVKVGSLIKETGQIQWEDVNSSKLEKFIQEFVLKNLDEMYPFFYLKCGDTTKHNIASQATQLVSVPLAIPTNTSHATKKDINVNILFLNAVSRRHFYRSLPKTIAAFRNINLNPKSTSNVLDFELYQALGATSQETLLGFVTGRNNNSQSTTEKTLLNHFKQTGYQTLWQNDKCWKSDVAFAWYFGIHNANIQNNLENLKVKLTSDNIDSLGLTHSSCVRYGENTEENNKLTNWQICINGRFQHDYFLDYIGQSLSEVNKNPSSRPLFSLTSLSLGKEESGRHIQVLDNSLATFVTKMAADKNTITILISDHGNTFDMFPVQTMEGQYEQYNPFLFMVLPTFVAWRLGESKKKIILNNQLKLISISDIHNMALSLVENEKHSNESHNHGLFTEIDANRNCAHLHLPSSSLCICDGWDSMQQPNTFHSIIAEFALGRLNNLIANQYTNQKTQEAPFVTCERLKGVLLRNISQKRIENGYIITQIDIFVQNNELFSVNVKWHGDNSPAMEMALVNYKRKHSDVEHNSCSTYIDRDLCVCHVQLKESNSAKIIPNWKKYGSVFGKRTKVDNRHNHCLYILSRDYGVSTVFEAANMCNDGEYNVRMNFELENMSTPGELPVNVTIPPMSIEFLTFVMPLHLTNPGTWEYEVDFSLNIK